MKKITLLFAALALVAGCKRRDNEIQIYRLAKDNAPAAPAANEMAGSTLPPMASQNAASPLTWKTPDGWTELTPGEMRVASFKISQDGKTADVSVIPLPGMAGTDSANVNRWRGQVGLAAATDDELQKSAETLQIGGQAAQLFDIAGTNPGNGAAERILGVIQHRDDGNAWFYKMIGDANLVEQQKPAFIQFLKSLKFTGAPAQTVETEISGDLPPGHPPVDNGNSTTSQNGQPTWQIPSDWHSIPPSQFLLAEFSIAGANGAKADVNVAELNGDGGGLAANVNRWRGQIGLAPLADDDLSKIISPLNISGGAASLVDFTGTNAQTGQPTRLIGAIIPENGQTWFYKLMGDAGVVQNQKAAFVKFVQSAKY